MTELDISVCICTRNPRREVFARVLAALAAQTLAPARWELIVIDNLSEPPLAGAPDLAPFPHARIVVEPRLGVAHARMRAIQEAAAGLIVFVDDDNVLSPDYLERGLALMRERPHLGAIGGRAIGEFEAPPPAWARHHLKYLAVIDFGPRAFWGLHPGQYHPWYPAGAGLVFRRAPALRHASRIPMDPARCAEDTELVLTIMDEGFGLGYFPELTLRHLIPRGRLTFAYLGRLVYLSDYALCRVMLARGEPVNIRPWPLTYLANMALVLLSGVWHPQALWLACLAARGRYHARRAAKAERGMRNDECGGEKA